MQFTSDWFSHVIPSWRRHVLPRLRNREAMLGLEIGAYEGRSAIWTLENLLTGEHNRLVCIDVWNETAVERRFDANVQEAGLVQRIIKQKGESAVLLRQIPAHARFDWIYIDGSHEARDCLTDAVLSFPLLTPGGILVFDDYGWKKTGLVHRVPKSGIDPFLDLWSPVIDVIHHDYQVILTRNEHGTGFQPVNNEPVVAD